jgi:RNA polymerase sigma factor for flagellar operon FliA
VQQLWERYRASGDPTLREQLVLSLAPLVKYIVYRKLREIPPRCEVEDFVSCGLEALLQSIERFDPDHGTTLEQFAWARIHGAVLDELRRSDWAPRSLRRWERDIARARETFFALYGRSPRPEELAEALGVLSQELERRLQEIARSQIGSLNALVSGEDEAAVEQIETLASADAESDPEQRALQDETRERLRAAFAKLSAREREVAVLLYVYELKLREVGAILGVSESRVCQIRSGLRRRLRKHLDLETEGRGASAAA